MLWRRLCEVGTPRCGVRTSQRDVPTKEFTTADVYAFERELEKLHPDNSDKLRAGRHVKDNPVKDFVSRGRNQAATSGVARHGIVDPPRSWRMVIAMTLNPQLR
jgi:hypothetical protein